MKMRRAFFITAFPGQARGNISGIVHKEFLKVTGDGEQNIRALLKANPTCFAAIAATGKNRTGNAETDLPMREKYLPLFPMEIMHAVHCSWTIAASVNQALVDMMNEICADRYLLFILDRLDIRYQSRELLEQGKSFFISGSEWCGQ